jgi:DNA polymerase
VTPIVIFDAETFYEDAKTALDPKDVYSLKHMGTAEYVRDPRFRLLGFGICVNDKPARYFEGDAPLQRIGPQLRNSIVVAHNAPFDEAILDWRYGIRPKGIVCTLKMARALGYNLEAGGSLKALCRIFGLGEKPELRPDSSPEEVALRGWWDADATRRLFHLMLPLLPRDELLLIDMTVRQFTESMVMADVPRLAELSRSRKAERAAALAEAGVDPKEVGSSDRMIEILEGLGVEVPHKPSPSVKDKWIPAFAKTDDGMQDLLEHQDARVRAVAEARLLVRGSTDDTRADTYINLARYGALPIAYKYWGAGPGRWSGDEGTNFANLKRGGVLRDCLLAPEGHHFVEADMKQIQARLTAWLAGQEDLLEAFREGRDVYCEFGYDLFGRTITKADEFERFCSKFWVLGGGFGMGGKKGAIQMGAEINKRGLDFEPPTEAEATMQVGVFRGRYVALPRLWDRMEELIAVPGRTLGPLTMGEKKMHLPNGTAIHYPGLRWENYKAFDGRSKWGWRYDGREGRVDLWGGKITQNSALALERVLLARFMVKLLPFWTISMHTYDSLTLCVKDDQVDNAKAALTHVMTTPAPWCPDLPLAIDIGVGRTYGECGNK